MNTCETALRLLRRTKPNARNLLINIILLPARYPGPTFRLLGVILIIFHPIDVDCRQRFYSCAEFGPKWQRWVGRGALNFDI